MFDFETAGEIALAVIAALILSMLAYIGIGEWLGSVNNVPLAIQPPAGESHIVVATSTMITRELDSGFCPKVIFWPGHIRYVR